MKMEYTHRPSEPCACAQRYDIDCSYKDLIEICRNIRGMYATKALSFLDKVIKKETFVRYRRYTRKVGHRTNGVIGRYPQKAARIARDVLRNAVANAEAKGMVTDALYVQYASANKQSIYPRVISVGRWMRHNYETSKIEIVLVEKGAHRSSPKKEPKKSEKKEEEEQKKSETSPQPETGPQEKEKAAQTPEEKPVEKKEETTERTKDKPKKTRAKKTSQKEG